jgi:hypothetical protein
VNLLVPWTARFAIACVLARWLLAARRPAAATPSLAECVLWSVGACIHLLHVAAAFELVHHWSHGAALLHTARQTAAVVGLEWGAGLYFNYAFTLLWIADAARLWIEWAKRRPVVPRWFAVGVQGAFAFMILNATVVFGPPVWKWAAAAFAILWWAACGSPRFRRWRSVRNEQRS